MFAERTAGPGEINFAPFDRYSPLHGLVGVVAGLIGLGFWPTFGITVAWEIVEHIFKNIVAGELGRRHPVGPLRVGVRDGGAPAAGSAPLQLTGPGRAWYERGDA